MTNITENSVNAFLNESNYKNDNTTVINTGVTVELRLHDNMIAYKILGSNTFYIQTFGWKSITTKERLNGLPNVKIKAIKGVWHLNGESWNGNLKEIKL